LRGEVVDLVGSDSLDKAIKTSGIGHIAVMEDKARPLRLARMSMLKVIDAPAIHGGGAPHNSVDLVSLLEQ